ncbi:hypothetical protein NM688_g3600 [Phlebia brevispora]|uniref:Uncharacterized protein n=1 Tax=Phlebia brevispora TaxID=194682 RepID=A0ACC1T534_9APHY|nr:hypothetical protein NM688_g3600 [Phlebia brevispora]
MTSAIAETARFTPHIGKMATKAYIAPAVDSTAVFKDDLFKGKVLFCTGGGSGICKEMTRAVMRHGADAAIVGRKLDRLTKSAEELSQATGRTCIPIQGDVRQPKALQEAVAKTIEKFGKIDFVICGAAGNFLAPISGLSENAFRTVMEIDALGTYHTIKATLPYVRQSKGAYIHVSATLHHNATPYQVHVSAAKAAVDATSGVLAVEEGPHGVRSNVIAPGPIGDTEGMDRLGTKGPVGSSSMRTIPMGRVGDLRDVANLTVFLFSDAASFITGQVIVVDGGHEHLRTTQLPYPDSVLNPGMRESGITEQQLALKLHTIGYCGVIAQKGVAGSTVGGEKNYQENVYEQTHFPGEDPASAKFGGKGARHPRSRCRAIQTPNVRSPQDIWALMYCPRRLGTKVHAGMPSSFLASGSRGSIRPILGSWDGGESSDSDMSTGFARGSARQGSHAGRTRIIANQEHPALGHRRASPPRGPALRPSAGAYDHSAQGLAILKMLEHHANALGTIFPKSSITPAARWISDPPQEDVNGQDTDITAVRGLSSYQTWLNPGGKLVVVSGGISRGSSKRPKIMPTSVALQRPLPRSENPTPPGINALRNLRGISDDVCDLQPVLGRSSHFVKRTLSWRRRWVASRPEHRTGSHGCAARSPRSFLSQQPCSSIGFRTNTSSLLLFALQHIAVAMLNAIFSVIFASLLALRSVHGFSLNVTDCPGYSLSALHETEGGLTAHLDLAGPACDAFGRDIGNLTLEVTYDTSTRLHVNIFDTAKLQFTVPSSVISLASSIPVDKEVSDLVFNYDPFPFAFWITRRSDPDAQPLFDTRPSSLPKTPIPAVVPTDPSTALDAFPLVFEDQYLQLTSALPLGTNIYGLGEVVASSGFRRDIGTNGGTGTIQTLWARDIQDPEDQNLYGSHSVYLEHRYDESTHRSQSHGVFLYNSAGSDIMLLTPPTSNVSLIEYRLIGGTLDFYFFSGPSPQKVIEQYGQLIGLPMWQPAWGFGFHLCRWGYHNVSETKEQVTKMREADIPLEVMWNDIDLYHALRDFTSDPVSFPADEMRAFIGELTSNNQRYIPIVDAAVAKQVNASDLYDPYTRGAELDVFVKNPDGTEYIGQVWPGYTVFPDWFANNTEKYWTEALTNWSNSGIGFSGIWLDMNEISSFCNGSCGTGANLSDTTLPFALPGDPGDLITDYPEGYNSTISGPSGNITVNGTLTYGAGGTAGTLAKRALSDATVQADIDLNSPPYSIHNGNGPLWVKTLATNATHAGGFVELYTHNLWGMMEEKTTHLALQSIHPGKRPFLISRSTFPSSGKWTGHWLGDNYSKWQYMFFSIQGALQFQIFQVPFVGADTCGFQNNTDEELCNRWMQLSAFMPFYRNHNQRGALSQEPYRWDSVANASRTAISIRYSLLPYWYTLFANASQFGAPPLRALFYEFPDEPELFTVDSQYLVGRDILVTPVLTPNVSTVDGILPGRGRTIWRDWYTHDVVNATVGGNTTLAAPLGHINVHVRDGSVILLHQQPGYTITETRQGPYSLLVSQATDGYAFGDAYIDDGESIPPTPSTRLTFHAAKGSLKIAGEGSFSLEEKLDTITILGTTKPTTVTVEGKSILTWQYIDAQDKLVVSGLSLDLNSPITLLWH